MDSAQRDQALLDVKSGMDPELVTEVMVQTISIKDQHLFVNPDENDPNPLSEQHTP
jgi:hypothetical protein